MKNLQRALIILAAGALILGALFVSIFAGRHMADSLTVQRAEVDRQIGRSIIAVIQKAMAHGVPFDQLVDAGRYLDSVKQDHASMQYLIVSDMQGRVLYRSNLAKIKDIPQLERAIAAWSKADASAPASKYTNIAFPITVRGQAVGLLHVGQPASMLAELLWDIAYDVLTILVVASIVAFGLMRLLLALSVSIPLRALHEILGDIAARDFRRYLPRDIFGGIGEINRRINGIVAGLNVEAERLRGSAKPLPEGYLFHGHGEYNTVKVSAIDHIQWPFFLLIFADSLSLSFFPFFVGQFYDAAIGLSKEVVIGVPISLFMLVWAIAMPWAGVWCDRVGYRRAFAVGAGVTTVGLVLTAYAASIVEIMLWRSVTAVGYGVVFVTAQAYISVNTPAAERTRGMALFLSSFFAGSLSGAAIGGILVDRLGYTLTFLLSAVLSSAAVLFVMRFVRRDSQGTGARKKLRALDFGQLLCHRRFATITFLAAVPAKIVLTGFLYYSVPLYLNTLGNDQSGTGRTMMAYGLAIILLSPTIAGLADRFGRRQWFVVVGGYAAAAGVAILCFFDGTLAVALAVTAIGIAHAVGVPPQLALVSDSCKAVVEKVGQATSAGIFRFMERLGNVLGPVLFGLLIARYGFKDAFGGIALLLFAVTTTFALLLLWFDRDSARGTHEGGG